MVSVPLLEPIARDHLVRCYEWERTPPLRLELPAEPLELGTSEPLVRVDRLTAAYSFRHSQVLAAREVSFSIDAGEALAIVGESGSGKTTVARCVVGLHRPLSGRIVLGGAELPQLAEQRPREALRRIQIVFQNPYESLNPRWKVRDTIARGAVTLRGCSPTEARAEVSGLVEQVRLPARVLERYPAELSGGERQRVAIARALAARPDLLICDEITSALDVSVQAAVVELLRQLRHEMRLSLLFISHDLGLVASVADRVLVLERGAIREAGDVRTLLVRPEDAYTQQLVAAVPRLPDVGQPA
jgi:peptide/nickel transport system ATP-binding protein